MLKGQKGRIEAMPEFFQLLPPEDAHARWWDQVTHRTESEAVPVTMSLDRVTARTVRSPDALPTFERSTVDGYAVRAADTFGASGSLPAYLTVVGEVLMGQAASVTVDKGQAALIHTGGMMPEGADAVVMVEYTQPFSDTEVEIHRPVAAGENVLHIGEDVTPDEEIIPAGHRLHPQDIGALLALGVANQLEVMQRPRVSLFSTGDELVPPATQHLQPGQIRDINSSTIQALCARAGAEAQVHPIVRDEPDALYHALADAFDAADMLVVTAGSSVSVRDITADTINRLGVPGVLVHGVAARPGKPTILAAVNGKPVMGLPGNPVSAIVMFTLFGVPAIAGLMNTDVRRYVSQARAAANIPSSAGQENYVPVKLVTRAGEQWAEPSFGKSNLIFTLVGADGLFKVPLNASGLREGTWGEVLLF